MRGNRQRATDTHTIIGAEPDSEALEQDWEKEPRARLRLLKSEGVLSDPMKELFDLLEASDNGCKESLPNGSGPQESLPRVISEPRQSLADSDERGWVGYKAACRRIATSFWRFLTEWFDSWFRVVLTGSTIGAVVGLVYRWILLPI